MGFGTFTQGVVWRVEGHTLFVGSELLASAGGLHDFEDELSGLAPPAAGQPERPHRQLAAPVAEGLFDHGPPPTAELRYCVLAGLFLRDDVAVENSAVQSGGAEHARDDAEEEAGHDCVSSQPEYLLRPAPPVTLEVLETPLPQLCLVAMDVQPVRGWAPDDDAALGQHTPCDRIHVESRACCKPPRAVRGDRHCLQR